MGRSANFADLPIGLSAAYALAAPSTPESAFEEALERAEAGETITHTVARAIIDSHIERPRIKVTTAQKAAEEQESAPKNSVQVVIQRLPQETVSLDLKTEKLPQETVRLDPKTREIPVEPLSIRLPQSDASESGKAPLPGLVPRSQRPSTTKVVTVLEQLNHLWGQATPEEQAAFLQEHCTCEK